MEKQMITLIETTYLLKYQIKQIREAFVKARIVPDNEAILRALKENFPDQMK